MLDSLIEKYGLPDKPFKLYGDPQLVIDLLKRYEISQDVLTQQADVAIVITSAAMDYCKQMYGITEPTVYRIDGIDYCMEHDLYQ